MLTLTANQMETWEKRSVVEETQDLMPIRETPESEASWWLVTDTLDMLIKQVSVLG